MIKDKAMELVEALRSGRYQQAKHKLRQGDSFCCLGVACDISKLSEWRTDKDGDIWYEETYTKLPQKVADHFGFRTCSGHINGPNMRIEPSDEFDLTITGQSLVDLNDSGASFKEIATIIENNWERL